MNAVTWRIFVQLLVCRGIEKPRWPRCGVWVGAFVALRLEARPCSFFSIVFQLEVLEDELFFLQRSTNALAASIQVGNQAAFSCLYFYDFPMKITGQCGSWPFRGSSKSEAHAELPKKKMATGEGLKENLHKSTWLKHISDAKISRYFNWLSLKPKHWDILNGAIECMWEPHDFQLMSNRLAALSNTKTSSIEPEARKKIVWKQTTHGPLWWTKTFPGDHEVHAKTQKGNYGNSANCLQTKSW